MNNPKLYNESNGLTRTAAVQCLNDYVKKIRWNKEGGKIIDLGCGDGSVTRIMRKYIPHNYAVTSSDINEKMLRFAQEHCAEDNITFRVQDAEGDLAQDLRCGFDKVFSFFLFHWIKNQEKAFKNVYSLLTDGGECLVTILKYVPNYKMYELVACDRKWGASWLSDMKNLISPYYYMEEPEIEITKMLKTIGFINIEVKSKQITHVMENGTELKNITRAVDPFSISNDVFEDFLNDCVSAAKELGLLDEADESFDDHDEPIHYNFTLLVIHASKPI